MAHYLLSFTNSVPGDPRPLSEQAADLLDARLWGVSETAQLRNRLEAGDEVAAYVGAPERAVVGHGILASGVHAWTQEELERYPGEFPNGVALAQARVWERPLSLASVWPALEKSRTNPSMVLRGGVQSLSGEDFRELLLEGGHFDVSPVSTHQAFGEGGQREVRRLVRARANLRKEKLSVVMEKQGELTCETCGSEPTAVYGDLGASALDCHHEVALATGEVRTTRLEDLRVLCANCQSVLHREGLSMAELQQIAR